MIPIEPWSEPYSQKTLDFAQKLQSYTCYGPPSLVQWGLDGAEVGSSSSGDHGQVARGALLALVTEGALRVRMDEGWRSEVVRF